MVGNHKMLHCKRWLFLIEISWTLFCDLDKSYQYMETLGHNRLKS